MRNRIAALTVFLAAGCGSSLPLGVGGGGGDAGGSNNGNGRATMPFQPIGAGQEAGGNHGGGDGGAVNDGGAVPDSGTTSDGSLADDGGTSDGAVCDEGSDQGPGEDGGHDGGALCTRTFGYWKTHAASWPVASLKLGDVVYGETELQGLLATRSRGDASVILAHQLIGALLNVAAGVTPPSPVAHTIDDAQTWMAANRPPGGELPYGIPTGTDAGSTAVALTVALDAFNQGQAGPLHCGP